MNKIKFPVKGLTLTALVGLGIPLGLFLWTLVVQWAYNAYLPTLGVPPIGFKAAAALSLFVLLIAGFFITLREESK